MKTRRFTKPYPLLGTLIINQRLLNSELGLGFSYIFRAGELTPVK